VSSSSSGLDQHGEASTWSQGKVLVPRGNGCDRMFRLQEQLCIDFEDPWVFISWLPLVPTEYLTVTALLDPIGRSHLVGCDGDIKHGVEAVVGFEALQDIVRGGMGGTVELLFQYLSMFLEGFTESVLVIGMGLQNVLQHFDASL
jgi:hypothetical protein